MKRKKIAAVVLLLTTIVLTLSACGVKNKQWTVTQCGSAEGNQIACYTIENEKGELILIDGGYAEDAWWVKEIIKAHDNHVVAWIITHPHPDHAGAFNMIMYEDSEIQVDHIYTIDVNYDRYKETAQSYDGFVVYETFLAITSEMDNVQYLKENDELEVLGLKMKVLHAWDEHTDSLNVNLLNNGSMMFVLEGEEDSMLFCADVENETESVILERHKEDLDVDYIQLGHHGNWGMTTEFYEHTNPKGVFFDLPNWIMDDTQSSYDAWILKNYFLDRGIKVYEFRTAPNEIILE